jgi:prolipoprotein diacylglyceryltransferase
VVSVHQIFESLAYLVAGQMIWHARRRTGDFLATSQRWLLLAAALSGAASGAYLVGAFDDPPGKTVVGGLLGATLGVEAMKWGLRLQRRTGDLYAVPIPIGIAIGRVGCFLTGLADNTHGVATSLPWGFDYGDGIPRHPTQLYEIAFCLALAWNLRRKASWMVEGDRYRLMLVAYLAFRFGIDFLKPGTSPAVQIACLCGIMMYAPDVARWARR